MRGYQLALFFAILTLGTAVWPGCGGSVSPPADSGEIIEAESELPAAGEPYAIEELDEKTDSGGGAPVPSEETPE